QVAQCGGNPLGLVQLPAQGKTLLEQFLSCDRVALHACQCGGAVQSTCTIAARRTARDRIEQPGVPFPTLREVITNVPQSHERRGKPQGVPRVGRGGPGQRSTKVVVLHSQPIEPGVLLSAFQLWKGLFGQCEKGCEVAISPLSFLTA